MFSSLLPSKRLKVFELQIVAVLRNAITGVEQITGDGIGGISWETRTMTAMPLMIATLCAMAIAYRYYSAFLAARVATLNDLTPTPAVRLNDGANYHPTSKWVLFGHHFAAISGAGPLIGPVLAAQFGYLPGLLWIVIGVCLAGAVQDFLVLVASTRRNGKSLDQIAFTDIGKVAGTAAMISILFILIIALAGLGKVVVKAFGGETVKLAHGVIVVPGSSWGVVRSSAITASLLIVLLLCTFIILAAAAIKIAAEPGSIPPTAS